MRLEEHWILFSQPSSIPQINKPSLKMDTVNLIVVATADRFGEVFKAAPTSADQLSVGLGGKF